MKSWPKTEESAMAALEAEVDGHAFDYEVWDTGVTKCSHASHVSGYDARCWRAEAAAFLSGARGDS